MRHVERQNLLAARTKRRLEKLFNMAASFFSVPLDDRRQRKYEFEKPSADIRNALAKMFLNKCAYCEIALSETSGEVDYFRPRLGALNLDGAYDQDYYWWLAYEWSNYYLACSYCSRNKRDRFPVIGQRIRPMTSGVSLLEEQPLLFDPCHDYPEQEMVFLDNGQVVSNSSRGQATIDILNLNREQLVEQRHEVAEKLHQVWVLFVETVSSSASQKVIISDVASSNSPSTNALLTNTTARVREEFLDEEKPFVTLRRQLLQQWIEEANSTNESTSITLSSSSREHSEKTSSGEVDQIHFLQQTIDSYQAAKARQESFSLDNNTRTGNYYIARRMIERVEISNFKAIQSLTLTFNSSTETTDTPWLVLLGENGTGKSSVLQALALALMGQKHRDLLNLDASGFVRYGCKRGFVRVHLSGSTIPIELKLNANSDKFTGNASDLKTPLLGYGSIRLLPEQEESFGIITESARVKNLFNHFAPLRNATNWLCSLSDEDFDYMARGLKQLLSLDDKDELVRDFNGKRSVSLKSPRSLVSIDQLSDGFQSVVALTADIMSTLKQHWEVMEIAEGIVLLDEIESHLHPRWKMQIVKKLREVFPRVQFLATSHDPLCLRGLRAGEVAVMRRLSSGKIVAETDLPDPSGLRVDQLLTSEFFGLNSTVDPEVEEIFNEYNHLLSLRRLTRKQEKRIAELKQILDKIGLLGNTRRERLLLEAADEFIAKEERLTNPDTKADLIAETKDKMIRLWESLDFEE